MASEPCIFSLVDVVGFDAVGRAITEMEVVEQRIVGVLMYRFGADSSYVDCLDIYSKTADE